VRGNALSKRLAALRRELKHARAKSVLGGRQSLNREPPTRPHKPFLQRVRHTTWFLVLEWIAGVLGTIGTLAGIIYGIVGPIWPVAPDIHPHEIGDDSSQVLPFVIKNRSPFEMKNVEFRCGVDLVWAQDAIGQSVTVRDTAFKEGVYSIGSTPINYPCQALDFLKVRPDGSLSMYGSSTKLESNPPKFFQEPWHVRKMCVWIRGDYKFLGIIPWYFTSIVFQWPADSATHRWIEGPIVRSPPKSERILGAYPDVLQCSPSPRIPYGMTVGPGRQVLVLEDTWKDFWRKIFQ
jgi:hypothetical protein